MTSLRRLTLLALFLMPLAGCPDSYGGDDDPGDAPGDSPPRPTDGSVPPIDATSPPGRDGSMPDGPDGSTPGEPDASTDPSVIPDGPCWSGTATACLCADGSTALRFCRGGAWSDECECAPEPDPDAECITPIAEWCNGRDDDCDGVIDETRVCPDPTIANTLPSTGTVFAAINPDGRGDGNVELRRVWPRAASEPSVTLRTEHPGLIRGTSGSFYAHFLSAFRRIDATGEEIVTIPPCDRRVWWFDIGADGELFYSCDGALFHGEGIVVRALPEGWPLRRTSSGSTLSFFGGLSWLDADGSDRVIDLDTEQWGGDTGITGSTDQAPVVGDSVFLVMNRYDERREKREIVVLRVDAGSETALIVRRVPVPHHQYFEAIALPDGTVFVAFRFDRAPNRLVVFPPAGPPRVLLDEYVHDLIYVP